VRYSEISHPQAFVVCPTVSGLCCKLSPRQGATPLHSSAFNGHVELSQMLVEAGANVHATNNQVGRLHLPVQ